MCRFIVPKVYAPIRDKYAADTEMWVTESGDAAAVEIHGHLPI